MAVDEASDAALLKALDANDEECALLSCVTDTGLRDNLLFLVLRSPVDEPVRVQVNARMHESDAFMRGSLADIVENGEYLDAALVKLAGDKLAYRLTCEAQPKLGRAYAGDDIEDHLLQYFAKDLIRFKTDIEVLCVHPLCSHTVHKCFLLNAELTYSLQFA